MPSHYAAYIKERWGTEVIEDERGFVSFRPAKDGMLIEDIYVIPELRSKGVARHFGEEVTKIAKNRGFSKLYGTVATSAPYSEYNVTSYIKWGFKIANCQNNVIYLVKEI